MAERGPKCQNCTFCSKMALFCTNITFHMPARGSSYFTPKKASNPIHSHCNPIHSHCKPPQGGTPPLFEIDFSYFPHTCAVMEEGQGRTHAPQQIKKMVCKTPCIFYWTSGKTTKTRGFLSFLIQNHHFYHFSYTGLDARAILAQNLIKTSYSVQFWPGIHVEIFCLVSHPVGYSEWPPEYA